MAEQPTFRDDIRSDKRIRWDRVSYDGTNTVVEVEDSLNNAVGRGVARRRKGDTRDPELGKLLAKARAHQALADALFAEAEKRLR